MGERGESEEGEEALGEGVGEEGDDKKRDGGGQSL